MAVKKADLENLELIIYIAGGVTLFLLFILFVSVGYLLKQVRKLTKAKDDVYEDTSIEDIRPSSLKPTFVLPKPNFSRNWHEDQAEQTDPSFHFSDGMLNHSEFGQNRFGAKPARSNFDNDRANSMPSRQHETEFPYGANNRANQKQLKKPDSNFDFGGNRLNQMVKPDFDVGKPRSNNHFGGDRNITKNSSNLHGAFRNPLMIAPDYDQDTSFAPGSNRELRPNTAYY